MASIDARSIRVCNGSAGFDPQSLSPISLRKAHELHRDHDPAQEVEKGQGLHVSTPNSSTPISEQTLPTTPHPSPVAPPPHIDPHPHQAPSVDPRRAAGSRCGQRRGNDTPAAQSGPSWARVPALAHRIHRSAGFARSTKGLWVIDVFFLRGSLGGSLF